MVSVAFQFRFDFAALGDIGLQRTCLLLQARHAASVAVVIMVLMRADWNRPHVAMCVANMQERLGKGSVRELVHGVSTIETAVP